MKLSKEFMEIKSFKDLEKHVKEFNDYFLASFEERLKQCTEWDLLMLCKKITAEIERRGLK